MSPVGGVMPGPGVVGRTPNGVGYSPDSVSYWGSYFKYRKRFCYPGSMLALFVLYFHRGDRLVWGFTGVFSDPSRGVGRNACRSVDGTPKRTRFLEATPRKAVLRFFLDECSASDLDLHRVILFPNWMNSLLGTYFFFLRNRF